MPWAFSTNGGGLLTLAIVATVIAAVTAPSATAARKGHVAQASSCVGTDARPLDVSAAEIRSATLCLINAERGARGLSPLRLNDRLAIAATRHSRHMVASQFFSHFSPGGSTLTTRVKKTAYLSGTSSWSLGENLAWGARGRANPQAIVNAWMNSPGHRANILNRQFRDIGIGVVNGTPRGIDDGATYTTTFGRRA